MMKGGRSVGFVIGIENCIGSVKRGTKCRTVKGIEKSTQMVKGGQSVVFLIRLENCMGPDKRGTKCRVVIEKGMGWQKSDEVSSCVFGVIITPRNRQIGSKFTEVHSIKIKLGCSKALF